MEPEQAHSKPAVRLERITGIILLIPPVVGVLLFVIYLLFPGSNKILQTAQLGDALMGRFYNGGYVSAAPIYLGLMAIAGSILLKGTDKK
jgi:hypothetical protein